jgi:hypothetical protein
MDEELAKLIDSLDESEVVEVIRRISMRYNKPNREAIHLMLRRTAEMIEDYL